MKNNQGEILNIPPQKSKKLKYFRVKKTSKTGQISYYWEINNKKISDKYDMMRFKPLGQNYTEAVKMWAEIMEELNYKMQYFKKYKQLPHENAQEIPYGSLECVAELYFADRVFTQLRQRTQDEYKKTIYRMTNETFLSFQKEPFARKSIQSFDTILVDKIYNDLLKTSTPRHAKECIAMLSILTSTAIRKKVYAGENPCKNMKLIAPKARQEHWSDEDIDNLLSQANKDGKEKVYLATQIAIYTAQRLTDVLALQWDDIEGEVWQFQQSKRGNNVIVPIHPKLRLALDLYGSKSGNVLDITERTLERQFLETKRKAGISDNLLFRDLRKVAVIKLEEAGCSPKDIAAITGWTRGTVLQMLEIYSPHKVERIKEEYKKIDQNKTS
jgi:integrase